MMMMVMMMMMDYDFLLSFDSDDEVDDAVIMIMQSFWSDPA